MTPRQQEWKASAKEAARNGNGLFATFCGLIALPSADELPQRPVKPLAQASEAPTIGGGWVLCRTHFGAHRERTTCVNPRS